MSQRKGRSPEALPPVVDVPFSPPDITEDDIEAVVDVLRSGWITTGPVSARFEEALVELTGAGGIVLQNSCTSALEQALRVSGVGPGDEVLVPAYTYSATAAAVLHVGARVVFVDNDAGAFVPSVEQYVAATTPTTKAIITVDVGGIPYPTGEVIKSVQGEGTPCSSFGLDRPVIITDAAHSLGATFLEKPVGSIADLTAFSFHAVKNLTTAEGGALAWREGLVASNERFYRELRALSLHGQTKDAYAKDRPGAWEYDIVAAAYKTNLPDVLAALGLSQLARYAQTLERRRALAAKYAEAVGDLATVVRHEGKEFLSSAHLALVALPEKRSYTRDGLIQAMAADGIASNVHYKPLPLMAAYQELGFDAADFPNAVNTFENSLSLPLYSALDDATFERICSSFRRAIEGEGTS